jgi:hypothetical protein
VSFLNVKTQSLWTAPKKLDTIWGYFYGKKKIKYDYAFKLKGVKLVLEKHYSCHSVSLEKG